MTQSPPTTPQAEPKELLEFYDRVTTTVRREYQDEEFKRLFPEIDAIRNILADLAQPRAVEKVEKVEREALQLEILSDFDSATQIEKLLILEVVDYLFGKGFIVAAQQKKAGE